MTGLAALGRRAQEILGREQKAYEAANPKSREVFQQASHGIDEALFMFGLNRGLFLSSGGRCCLSTAMGDAEVEKYLATVEEFLGELVR